MLSAMLKRIIEKLNKKNNQVQSISDSETTVQESNYDDKAGLKFIPDEESKEQRNYLKSNKYLGLPIANALGNLLAEYGWSFIENPRVLNALTDYNAFVDNKSLKSIFRTLILSDFYNKIISLKSSINFENEVLLLKNQIQQTYGFIPGLINQLIWEILLGLNICDVSQLPYELKRNLPKDIISSTKNSKDNCLSKEADNNVKVNLKTRTNLSFMGITLDNTIFTFEKELIARGFKKGKSISLYTRFFGNFLDRYCIVYLYGSPISQTIYRVQINLKDNLKKEIIKQHYRIIKNTYESKYGKPSEEAKSNKPYFKYVFPQGKILVQCSPFQIVYEDTHSFEKKRDEQNALWRKQRIKEQKEALRKQKERQAKLLKNIDDI